jgi:hypothetical protein
MIDAADGGDRSDSDPPTSSRAVRRAQRDCGSRVIGKVILRP